MPILVNQIKNEKLKHRVANEVYTYVYGAYKYKRRYYLLTFLSVSLPAVIVAINSSELLQGDISDTTVSFLSMATVIVSGIMGTMKSKESWVRYREYAESAKQEIFNCVMEIGEYDESKKNDSDWREKKLALNLENLYSQESGQWKTLRKQKDESGGDSQK